MEGARLRRVSAYSTRQLADTEEASLKACVHSQLLHTDMLNVHRVAGHQQALEHEKIVTYYDVPTLTCRVRELCRCTWEAADSVDAKHVKEYRQRLGLRASGKAKSKALELPLQLAPYVPPKLVLKDYQIEGETSEATTVGG